MLLERIQFPNTIQSSQVPSLPLAVATDDSIDFMPGAIEQHFGTKHEATIELTSELGGGARISSRHVQRRGLVDTLREIFLPEGYPESVSDDYFEYQVRRILDMEV